MPGQNAEQTSRPPTTSLADLVRQLDAEMEADLVARATAILGHLPTARPAQRIVVASNPQGRSWLARRFAEHTATRWTGQ